MAELPHFAFPFARGPDGKVAVLEQDTQEHVMACLNVIVRCPVGFRIERPDFGVTWHDYRQDVIPAGVMQAALREFEDRAKTVTEVERDLQTGDARITVEVEVEAG